jgi:hypothetical protein
VNTTPETQPALRVITPGTTPEQIAAIVTVLAALNDNTPAPAPPRSTWARPHHRRPLPHGPGAWRASSLPN